MSDLAARHAGTAADFTALVDGVSDWGAPSPVAGWTARDVVGHLTVWLPGLLGASGVTLRPGPSAMHDPVGAWAHHVTEVQALLDDPARARDVVGFPGGEKTVESVVADFYEPDVFMHSWDLARASGQDFHLDETRCTEMVAGMSAIEPMLRESGQFGSYVDPGPDPTAEQQLIGFIGRDPHWQPA